MCVYPRCGEMTSPNVEKKSHSDTMFWCWWRAIINNTWTRKLSNKEVSLFTFKGAKPTEPASLSWGRFVPVFYGAMYIITISFHVLITFYCNSLGSLFLWLQRTAFIRDYNKVTGTLAQRLECSPMARETWVQSQVESYQRL